MANPQWENGYTRIAQELLDALIRYKMSGREFRIVMCIIRKTYGYSKKSDRISYSQISNLTDISKPHVSDVMKVLFSKNIITRLSVSKYGSYELKLQKDYTKWQSVKSSRKREQLPKTVTVTENGVQVVPSSVTTKERKKEKAKAFSVDIEKLSTFFRKNMKVKIKTQNEQGWLDEIDKMHRIDKRPYNEIQSLFEFIFSDPFWSNQPIGPISLRKKDRDGIMRFDKILAQMNRGLPKKRNLPSDIRL